MSYAIWGCGKRGRVIAMLLQKAGAELSAFIDMDKGLWGSRVQGIPVMGYEEYLKQKKGEPVLIAVKGHGAEIAETLKMDGIKSLLTYVGSDSENTVGMLNQLRLCIDRVIMESGGERKYGVYGESIYGVCVCELLRSRGISCRVIARGDFADSEGLSCVFMAEPDGEAEEYFRKPGCRVIQAHEIYQHTELFYHPELGKFKGIHKGEDCFIIGNGPSLRMEDLDALHNNGCVCMGVNGIFKAFDKTAWRPDYFCATDTGFIMQNKEAVLRLAAKEKFIGDSCWLFEENEAPENFHMFHFDDGYDEHEPVKFTEDCTKEFFWGKTVIYDCCLQLAVYMGFSRIYLLGCDCTTESERGRQHFTEDYEDENFGKTFGLDTPYMFRAYQSAKDYADANGIKIYNATRGGKLEVFERVEFDSLF